MNWSFSEFLSTQTVLQDLHKQSLIYFGGRVLKYCLFWNINIQACQHHGAEFVEYKCRYCCSLAVFFCFGTTHFCNRCHDDAGRLRHTTRLAKCPAGPTSISLDSGQCPLKMDHPPTGEEFVLGCAICRNIQSFWCHSFGNIYYTYLAMRIYKINVGMTGNFQELEILGGAYKRTLETWEHQ